MSGKTGGVISANLRWKEEWEKEGKMVGQEEEEMGGIGEIGANLWWKALTEEEERKKGGEDFGGEKVDDMVHLVKP